MARRSSGSATTKIKAANKPPKQKKAGGISTPFHNRIMTGTGRR